MATYPMHVAGLDRDFPICKVTDDLYIGAFIMFGDAELTVRCAEELLKLAEGIDYDYLFTAEAKSIPLIHEMETRELPIRILAPGRVYRKDEVDATHSPMFHQIEGMAIDKGITMADLKGTLNEVVRQLYGEHTVTRFRPHHFPFTEPSCEMDIQCHKCHGAGCPTCKGEGWIEVLGAGMIHPKVLEGCGIDSTVYSGWAFGMGLERLALGHFKISDLRLIFENDVRFLEQF